MRLWLTNDKNDWEVLVEFVSSTSADGMPKVETHTLATVQKVAGGYWTHSNTNGKSLCLGASRGIKEAKQKAEFFTQRK